MRLIRFLQSYVTHLIFGKPQPTMSEPEFSLDEMESAERMIAEMDATKKS